MTEEISEKLLVVIQAKHLANASFITNGPVANLRRSYPNSVFSIIDQRVGISGSIVSAIKCDVLINTLSSPIKARLAEVDSRTTLDLSKFSHICKCYVGLLNEFYALKDNEIIDLLTYIGFNINMEILDRLAFCCAAVRWATYTTSGFDRVHFALPLNEATSFDFKQLNDKLRRRTEFRQYWIESDPDRVAAVDEGLGR